MLEPLERGPHLATGALAFLFTDIAGSTQLWERQPQAMTAALARHDAILRMAIETAAGRVVKTTGDGLMAVFPTAVDARGGQPGGPAGPRRRALG